MSLVSSPHGSSRGVQSLRERVIQLTRYSSVRYLLVGVTNTAVGLVVIFLCLGLFGLPVAIANPIGYAVGIVWSFLLNARYTFRHQGPKLPAFVRFVVVTGAAFLVQYGFVLGIVALGVDPYLAQPLGVIPYTLTGYLGSRFYAFAVRGEASTSEIK
ncbi:MAG: GtrA family protein [Pseudomonadota bacterium]